MATHPIVYQDVADAVLAVAPRVEAPQDEPFCFTCALGYGSPGPGIETHLDYFSQLPGAFRKTFIQHVVEASRTACGHVFCTFCLAAWFKDKLTCTCPMCRKDIVIPYTADIQNTDDGLPNVGIEGLSLSLNVSSPSAAAIYEISQLQVCDLLTTTTSMPFIWNAAAMIHDLPRIMVSIARRMHYQALRRKEGVPKDLPHLTLHKASDRSLLVSKSKSRSKRDLKFLQCADAPHARHLDAHELYDLLCPRIAGLEDVVGNHTGSWSSWEGAARDLLLGMVRVEMPDADGGVGQAKWWAYVWCVVKALCVWQTYCGCAQRLVSEWVERVGLRAVRASRVA